MSKIVFASRTGNVQRFISKLKEALPEIEYVKATRNMTIDEPFYLITYTTGFGQIPKQVSDLLKSSSNNLLAVIGSGHTNWGDNYCKASRDISSQYDVPLLHKFVMSGTPTDVDTIASKIRERMNGVGKMD
ncbi:class Ib ribonucleoside-diphosphate reductase assembly flavoprotein NrdI [Virgibacillus sp. M23]|uniref:class Ib ribonucleoside-diphosphate reductase assembly flavoprotein NrdI n=1 Tax=Virgibacillus sp. M23 TaxID=3079030 RepID=UPI002A90BEC0|nr:class Ib ribonucleoside-diphosphate reductase assembly flavoprotein NrdI [Virgibacillus sp. M23]MDY7043720.1 class Ib ribonucleoside-diphosphate reductase assembly flavoprotein NrdI [Virgibacillus sp. M23]